MPAPAATCPSCSAPLTAAGACPGCGRATPAPDDTERLARSSPISPGTPFAAPDESTDGHETLAAPPGPPRSAEFAFLAPPQQPDELGRLGPYRVVGKIGAGGMGAVFRAEDPALRRHVALKVMLPQFASNTAAKGRFLREARAQAAVEHDHIISIFQVGEEGGVPFLAMPLLKGVPLSDALREARVVPVAEAVRIAREVAVGLAAAHAQGLVHRDIKPANVWLEGPARRVKILDFGLAVGAADPDLTEEVATEAAVVGTPAYMSPEQARGAAVDARTDLWSLGVVLYQMLTGDLPFRGPTARAVLNAVRAQVPPPPCEKNPAVPPALSALVARLMAKPVADRPATAAAVVAELEAFSPRAAGPAARGRPGAGRWAWVAAAGMLGLATVAAVVALTRGKLDAPALAQKAAPPAAAPERPADERPAAEFVLAAGGTVWVNAPPAEVRRAADLPRVPFVLAGVQLAGPQVGDADLAVFKGARNLLFLQLNRCSRVGDAGIENFKASRGVVLLNLGNTRVTDAGLAQFAGSAAVRNLGLDCTAATDAGLANFKNCKGLEAVWVNDTAVGDAGVAHLAGCRALATLSLHNTRVTDAGLAHLGECTELASLSLDGTRAGDAGLATVAASPKLKTLSLGGCDRVTDAGLQRLAGAKALETLDVRRTKVTGGGVSRLAAALPRCRIEWDGGVAGPAD
ncbi:protein kinase domain-containing protein [Gemmata sp.]|uniref:protein kinase domain-containing protein n=1 Tax=Gemmata sp. TaxID=1914242 RepID=UPI003F6E87EF